MTVMMQPRPVRQESVCQSVPLIAINPALIMTFTGMIPVTAKKTNTRNVEKAAGPTIINAQALLSKENGKIKGVPIPPALLILNGKIFRTVVKIPGLITIAAKEIGFRDKKEKEAALITNVMITINGIITKIALI
jgi:hypothetical protein